MLGRRLEAYVEKNHGTRVHAIGCTPCCWCLEQSEQTTSRSGILDELCGRVSAHKNFVARQKSVVSLWKRSLERAAITLH
jgi:hypothetical protein